MTTKNGKIWIGALVVAVVGALAVGGSWYLRHRRASTQCFICSRPVHAVSRTVVERGGDQSAACCPACALALRAQTGKKVRVLSVADFDTHRELVPEQAAFVVGSDQRTCAEHSGRKFDQDKRSLEIHYDRCEPGIVAFAKRERATEFAREHGGKLATLAELGVRER